jgi:phage shock protein PspC (stress-responsive transcriptional regulator)
MKKTISISLAGTLFWIEEDAYQTLEHYIKEIKAHFAKEPECDEIVSDIESRIAEQFLESKKKIISSQEVSAMVASMGDFGSTEETSEPKKEGVFSSTTNKSEKHLFRNPDDKVIGGVASGIGAYLGVDVVWVRAVFIALIFLNGIGFFLYLFFWISMPEAKSASERLEMKGAPVTLATISERVKERVEEVREDKDGTLRRIVQLPLEGLRTIIRFISHTLFPILRKIIGILISLFAAITLLALSIAFGFAILNTSENIIGFPIHSFAPTSIIILFLFAAYFSLFVPLLFISFLGTSLTAGKSTVRMNTAASFLGFWFIALLTVGIIAANFGTKIASHVRTAPEYQETSQVMDVSPFTKIEAKNGVHVTYQESATTSVTLIGRTKDLGRLSVKSENGTLFLEPIQNSADVCIFCDFSPPRVEVRTPMIESFTGENMVRFDAVHITAPSFTSSFTNGSRGTFDIITNELSVTLKNVSGITLSGTAEKAKLTGENGTETHAENLFITNAIVNVTNGSRADIGKTEILEAKATNGGYIRYEGTPSITQNAENGSRIESAKSSP